MTDPIILGAIIGGLIGLGGAVIFMLIMKVMAKKVPRFSRQIVYLGDINQLMLRLERLLEVEGYYRYDHKGEEGIYKKGSGVLVAKQFIKLLPQDGSILVEGFISIYGTDSGLRGFTGAIPKKSCKKVVENIINQIENASKGI